MTASPSGKLGRGLAALLADAGPADLAASNASTRTLPIELLEQSSFQPRLNLDEAALDELAASIRARGLLQPLLVRPHPTLGGRFEIVAGERRWRAAQKAGLTEVPVLIRNLGLEEALAAALVENLQRHDLNAIEEAEGYQTLLNQHGLTQERLSDAIGKSRSHIANTVRLLRLPPPLQNYVRQGSLSAGHARALLSHYDPEKAAAAVIARGLNVRQTENLAIAQRGDFSRRDGRRHSDPDALALEQSLVEHIGMKVVIRAKGAGGSLTIHYESAEQLDGLVSLLSRP